ncbi:MAG: helix-turn-helix domain-containing protein [Fimbriimonas sp.]
MPAWNDRLNSTTVRLPIGGGRVEVVVWAYEEHLLDNQPHRHTYFEACLVGGYGKGTFTASGIEYPLTPGTFFLARPGVVHQIRNAPGEPLMELFWVGFGWIPGEGPPRSEAERRMNDFVDAASEVAVDEQGRLRAIWEALRVVVPQGLPEQARALATTLVVQIAQTLDPEPSAPAEAPVDLTTRLAVRYVADNLNRPLTLEEIAAHVHVSPRHLTRLFTAFAGTSPLRYVMTARLDRASGLLTGSDLPVKEIAERVGFGDVHHFTRCFARHFGVPPAAYRRGERGGHIVQKPGALV